MEKFKKISLVVLISSVILIFMAMLFFKADDDISKSERRKLLKKPKFTVKKVFDKRYFPSYEKYLLDQFPLREEIRKIKAFSNFNILGKKDNNEVFFVEDNIFKLDKELNEKQVELAIKRINSIIKKHPEARAFYYSVIPDKSHFAKDYPKIDLTDIENLLSNQISGAKYINISKLLELNDYYKTDPHWSSSKIEKIAKEISINTNGSFYPLPEAKEQKLENFYGAFHGQLALNLPAENMTYFDSPVFKDLIIKGASENQLINVYDEESFSHIDPYDFFLGGPQPLIFIENTKAKSDKELVIFRDSFGSSLAPLLVENYRKITLVDIRYMSTKSADKFITYDNAEVLFIYSTSLWNSGGILK